MLSDLFDYDAWPSRLGQGWGQANRGPSPWDNLDFHVDLGCGKLPKGRIGVDRLPAAGVAVVADLDNRFGGRCIWVPAAPGQDAADNPEFVTRYADRPERPRDYDGLPFADNQIKSVISHHCFEHIGDGFVPLVDEIYRCLEPGGILRAITPLFPSWSAVADPDHRRYFMAHQEPDGRYITTWDVFCGTPTNCWLDSFSVPYTKARFELVDCDYTPPTAHPWTPADARELRVALKAIK